MNKKLLPLAGLFIAAVLAVLAPVFWANRMELERRILEYSLNRAGHEYFAGTFRLSRGYIDRNLRLHMYGLNGDFQTFEGSVPVRLDSVESVESLARLLQNAPVMFKFYGVRPASSPAEGIRGEAVLKPGRDWSFKLRAEIVSLGLEDVTWLNPENLQGASGKMLGTVSLASDARTDPAFGLEILVHEPGGNIQAGLFNTLLPYLPAIQARSQVRRLAGAGGLLNYRDAKLVMNLAKPDELKIFFHIAVPDYNLHLNLNMLIRIDEKNSFFKLAQVMGLVQIKTGREKTKRA